MRRYILLFIALCLHVAARGQTIADIDLSWLPQPTQAKALRYWFDDDGGSLQTTNTVNGTHTVDVSSLLDGLHTIHFQVIDSEEKAAYIASSLFLKTGGNLETGTAIKASKMIYWFDNDTTILSLDVTDGVQMLDASEMIEGLHTLHYQVLCNNGQMTPAMSSMFLRLSIDTETAAAKSLRYWFDDGQEATEVEITDGVQLLDASDLLEGLHTVHYQVMGSTGMPGVPCTSVFLKIDADMTSATARSVRYWFDDDATTVKITDVANGTQTLDVSALTMGLHTLNYQLIDSNGKVSVPVTGIFLKSFDKVMANGHNSITKYQYWLNDNSATVKTVTLGETSNPYTLTALLPVESQPFRSSSFHFENKDGKPMMYAKNDFHVRFTDAAGYCVDDSRPFTDYSVSREVVPVGELQATQTFPKVAENDVRWYTVEAERGDSMQFMLDRAATIQLFSPTGEEVYHASGSDAVKWGGCHAKKNGTYYLALHDVTAQQGTTIKLEYNMIGKYAILDYTPSAFAANGTTIMHLTGNGLNFVKSIGLVNDKETLYPDTIVANTTDLLACFVLNTDIDVEKTYSLNVFFCNEEENDNRSIVKMNAVTIEPANKGDIAISIETEKRVGDPYPIKVTIKNTGNVGYYDIPVDIAFDHPDRIDEFRFMNFELLLSDSIYNCRGFFTYTDNLVGTGQKGFFMPILIPYLAPNEERTYIFGVKTKVAHAKFNFYAWTSEPSDNNINDETGSSARRKAPPCNPSNIPDAYNAADHGGQPGRVLRPWLGAAEAISGIIQGSTRAREDAVFDAAGIPEGERDNYRFQYQHCVRSPYDIARDAHPFQIRRKAANSSNSIDTHASSDCPNPDPHSTDVYIPGDPNEMHGIVSEAGSKYIMQEIMDISYTIEFENDPELANASAHKIVVRDTLNTKVFDTSTFKPASVKIGDKSIDLDGEQNFVKTIDMRTDINAIAQIQLEFNKNTGIAVWTISSLDPMTMEETYDIMQGVLPINNGGNGIGYLSYDISLKKPLADGTQIKNRAGIVFDYEEAILTPTWTNIVDAVPPTSRIDNSWMLNDSTLRITADAFDARSGVWKYEWYVQAGENAPWWKEGETESPQFDYHIFEGIDYGFCVLATDSAGNVEQKVIQRERGFKTYGQDFEDRIDEANGQSSMVNGQSIYDLSGRRQAVPKENQVNIIDKKKVLIR